MIPVLHQNPRDPDFIQNPYPFYARARKHGRFFLWQEYEHLCCADYLGINTILRDRRFGRAAPQGFAPERPAHLAPFYAIEQHSLLELEPPKHTRLRALLTRAFTNRRIAELEPQIDALARNLIADFPADTVDLLPAFCEKIPIIIITRLLGVPESMADQLLAWSHDMVAMYQVRRDRMIEDAAVRAAVAFSAFLREYIQARRTDPRDDLITDLIMAQTSGDQLSTDELITTCILLLNAGHEATVHSFANGIKTILENPHPDNRYFNTPQTTLQTIEETLRFDPPLHMFTRFVMEDLRLFDHDFKKGDVIGLLLGAANRDPEKFPEPDRFDPHRGGKGNLSFGGGLHFCIGAPLARLEMAVALPILFGAFPNMRLSATPQYTDCYHFHGLETLKVSL
ncbi:MAG: cytochrome P450 [Paracoccaceae bacterium]